MADPAHSWFYAERNDRMPAYVQAPADPAKNRLSFEQADALVSWLRGEWYEPQAAEEAEPAKPAAPATVLLGKWEARRTPQAAEPPADPRGKALAVFQLGQCALCHDFADEQGKGVRCRQPVAPTLHRFASAEWLRGTAGSRSRWPGPSTTAPTRSSKKAKWSGSSRTSCRTTSRTRARPTLDDLLEQAAADSKQVEFALQNLPDLKKQIGEEELRKRVDQAVKDGKFAEFVKENGKSLAADLGKKKLEQLIAGLAAGAQQDDPKEADDDTLEGFETFGCADCHKYFDTGDLGSAPDLTGYGSRAWLAAIIANPEHKRFYPDSNDGMPAYLAFPDKPQKNLLTKEQIQQLADLLRGKLDSR